MNINHLEKPLYLLRHYSKYNTYNSFYVIKFYIKKFHIVYNNTKSVICIIFLYQIKNIYVRTKLIK